MDVPDDRPSPNECHVTLSMALDMAVMCLQHDCAEEHTGQPMPMCLSACQLLDTLREVMTKPGAQVVFPNVPLTDVTR